MENTKFYCECGKEFMESEFKTHFHFCNQFKIFFKDFDSKISQLLIDYSKPKERLFIIKFLLKQYILIIDNKLKESFNNIILNNKSIKNHRKLIKEKNQQYLNLKELKDYPSSSSLKKKRM